MYVYDEIQYTKDEYIKMMDEKSVELKNANTQNRSDIEYLMLITDNADELLYETEE